MQKSIEDALKLDRKAVELGKQIWKIHQKQNIHNLPNAKAKTLSKKLIEQVLSEHPWVNEIESTSHFELLYHGIKHGITYSHDQQFRALAGKITKLTSEIGRLRTSSFTRKKNENAFDPSISPQAIQRAELMKRMQGMQPVLTISFNNLSKIFKDKF